MPVGVIGAGAIGKTHIDRALRHADVELVGIADPSSQAEGFARRVGVPWFADYGQMLDVARPQGVMVATPNVTHARIATDCLERGVAVIVEKPVAHTVEDAQHICDVSRIKDIPALVGHHRRYNPIVRHAKQIIDSGKLAPVIDRILPLSEARRAHELSEAGHTHGKIVLRVNNRDGTLERKQS